MTYSFAEYKLLQALRLRKHLMEWLEGLCELLETIPTDSPMAPAIREAIANTQKALQQQVI